MTAWVCFSISAILTEINLRKPCVRAHQVQQVVQMKWFPQATGDGDSGACGQDAWRGPARNDDNSVVQQACLLAKKRKDTVTPAPGHVEFQDDHIGRRAPLQLGQACQAVLRRLDRESAVAEATLQMSSHASSASAINSLGPIDSSNFLAYHLFADDDPIHRETSPD